MKTQLTRNQAIEEGFTKFGYPDREWQTANDISDISDSELLEQTIVLFSKEPSVPRISPEQIKDILSDHIEDAHGNDTGDDTNQVWEIVRSLDFEPTAKMINEALSSYECYKLTDIQLVP